MTIQQRIALALQLHAAYFRPWDVAVDRWESICGECGPLAKSGLRVILTVRNTGGGLTGEPNPGAPPDDLDVYKRALGDILDKYNPEVLVVENEENSDLFYTGTPEQYFAELAAGCELAHAHGIKCTNGGIVSGLVVMEVWNEYAGQGKASEACALVRRAASGFDDPRVADQLCAAPDASALAPALQNQLKRGLALLSVYRNSSIDYLNFHWYVPESSVLDEAAAFLKRATGRPLMSNEMGEHGDDPAVIPPLLQKAVDLQLPYVVWYSLDLAHARALNNPDGTWRPSGVAFQSFLQANFH